MPTQRTAAISGDRDVCWYCGGRLIWDSDFAYDDIYEDGKGIVTYLHCADCGAEVEYRKREEDENV